MMRLELVQQERLRAMKTDAPLSEMPIVPPQIQTHPKPDVQMTAIVLANFGVGCIIAFRCSADLALQNLWAARPTLCWLAPV